MIRKKLSTRFSHASFKFLIDTLVHEIELLVAEKHELENRGESIILASFEIWDYQFSDAGNKIDSFSTEWFAKIPKLLIETLVEEFIENEVLEKLLTDIFMTSQSGN